MSSRTEIRNLTDPGEIGETKQGALFLLDEKSILHAADSIRDSGDSGDQPGLPSLHNLAALCLRNITSCLGVIHHWLRTGHLAQFSKANFTVL